MNKFIDFSASTLYHNKYVSIVNILWLGKIYCVLWIKPSQIRLEIPDRILGMQFIIYHFCIYWYLKMEMREKYVKFTLFKASHYLFMKTLSTYSKILDRIQLPDFIPYLNIFLSMLYMSGYVLNHMMLY